MDAIKEGVQLRSTNVKPENTLVVGIDKALESTLLALQTSDYSHNLPVIKFQQGASAIEVLERVVQSLKESLTGAPPAVTVKSGTQGKVVEEKKELTGWVVPTYWKDNIQQIEDTTEHGAKIAIALPKNWNRKCLLMAHGHRPEGVGLIANLPIDEDFLSDLLKEGWLVGMSSYRRDGVIVRDAVEDMNNLKHYIVKNIGKPILTLLEGRSMGGCIVTHIAENYPYLYDGIVAIGAALIAKDDVNPLEFQYKPEIPILYLTNQSELGPIENYISNVRLIMEKGSDQEQHVVLPALWEVWREGHNHVSQEERRAALKSLEEWIKHKTFITVRKQNMFIQGEPKGDRPQYKPDGSVVVKVRGLENIFHAFMLNIVESEMVKAGIRTRKFFTLTTKSGKSVEVLYDTFPFMCQQGTWFAFDHPDGFLTVSIFGWFAVNNASGELGIMEGDEVVLRPVQVQSNKLKAVQKQ